MARKKNPYAARDDLFASFFSDENSASLRAEMEQREEEAFAERERLASTPSFTGLTNGQGSTEPGPAQERGVLDQLLATLGRGVEAQAAIRDSALAGAGRTVAGSSFAAQDNALPVNDLGKLLLTLQDNLSYGVADTFGLGDEYSRARVENLKGTGEMFQQAQADTQAAEARMNRAIPEGTPFLHKGARAAQDIVGSPSSLASMGGGLLAAVPMLDVYGQEYTQARLAGLSEKDADIRAKLMMSTEGVMEAIPTGKVADAFGFNPIENFLKGKARNVAGKITGGALVEGGTETGTEALNIGVDSLMAQGAETPEARAYAQQNLPKSATDVWSRLERSFLAGAGGGGALTTPMAFIEDAAQQGALVGNALQAGDVTQAQIDAERRAGKPRISVGPTTIVPPAKPRTRFEGETQLTSSPEVAAPAAVTPEAEVSAAPELDTVAELDSMITNLRSEAITPSENAAPVTKDEVLSGLVNTASKGQSRQALKLIADGNLAIVQNANQIPAGTKAAGSAGFYDGKRTYIVADQMDGNKPFLGQLMETLSHETVHAGDVSGKLDSVLVGRENNDRLNRQITNVAEARAKARGATLDDILAMDSSSEEFANLHPAEQAYHYANNYTNTNGAKKLEMSAYLVSFARKARNADGATKTLLKNTLSAARSKWNAKLGHDVNMNDVAYLSDKLVLQAAAKGERLTGNIDQTIEKFGGDTDTNTNGLSMIGGVSGEGFVDAMMKGDLYEGLGDKKPRYEFGDEHAEVDNSNNALGDIVAGKTVRLDQILKHDELYKNYPHARKIKVKFDDSIKGDGAYSHNSQTIEINPSFEDALNHKEVREELRLILLHEVQHNIQAIEGFSKGASFHHLMPRSVVEDADEAQTRLDNAKKKFELGAAVKSLDPANRVKWNQLLASNNISDRDAAVNAFFKLGFHNDVTDPTAKRQIREYEFARDELLHHTDKYNAASHKAFKEYLLNHGEAEARNTEHRSRHTAEERAKHKPNDTILTDKRSSIYKLKKEDLTNETTKSKKAESNGLRSEPINNPNFKKWAGDSKLSSPEDPKVFYTGTSKDKDFKAFNIPRNGAWFTLDPQIASDYAVDNDSKGLKPDDRPGARPYSFREVNTASRVFPVYLKGENPYVLTQADHDAMNKDNYKRAQGIFFDGLRAKGYDSAIVAGTIEDPRIVAILNTPQQIKSVNNNGEFSDRQTDVLRSEPLKFERTSIPLRSDKAKNKFARTVERLLHPGGFHDQTLKEILMHSRNLPAAMAIEATYLNNRFREAIDDNVTKSNGRYTQKTFREMLGQRVDRIDELPLFEHREAAIDALNREFPGIGKALNEIRTYKRSLTTEILNQRKRDPSPLTEKERNTFAKMIFNAERYNTRAYMATAFDQKSNKAYGRKMLEQFHKKPDSEEAKIVQEALDYLLNKELIIPDEETLELKHMDKLRQLYENWIGPSDSHKGAKGKAKMIDDLLSLRAKTKEEMEAKAYEIVEDMLGINEEKGPIAKANTPSNRQNRSILEKRTDIPVELRRLLGEITDPMIREQISLNKMSNLIAKTKFLTEAYEQGKGKWWSDTKSNKFGTKLDNEAYGPLNKKWVSADMADAITGAVNNMGSIEAMLSDVSANAPEILQAVAGGAFTAMNKIMAAQKTNGVVMDFYNGAINFVGAALIMSTMNGTYTHSLEGMKGAGKVLVLDIWNRKYSGRNSKIAQELVRNGVTDSATMGEFKGHAYDEVRTELKKLLDTGAVITPAKVFNTAYKVLFAQTKPHQALRTAYAFMDVWVKAATYYDRKEYNTKFNEAEAKANPDYKKLTEEQIERKSGYEAAGTNISYERGIPLVKALERSLPIFMFLTYKTEVVRASVASYMQAIADLKASANAKSPEAKKLAAAQGMKRAIGTTVVIGSVIAGTLAKLASEDDDEKKKRKLDFPWMQNALMMKLGKDKDGNEVMWNLSRVDPLGPLNEMIVAYGNAEEGEGAAAVAKALEDFVFAKSSGFAAVYTAINDAAVAAYADVANDPAFKADHDMKIRGKSMAETDYPEYWKLLQQMPGDIGENLQNAAEKLFVPAQLKPFITDKGKTDPKTADKGPLGEVLRYAGMSQYVRDPDKALTGKAIDHDKAVKALEAEKKRMIAEDRIDLEDLQDLAEQERQAFQELSEGLEGYLAFDDTSIANANEIIGDKKLAAQLRTGKFKSKLLDAKALETWKKSELKKRGADKAKINEDYRLLKKLYREAD